MREADPWAAAGREGGGVGAAPQQGGRDCPASGSLCGGRRVSAAFLKRPHE